MLIYTPLLDFHVPIGVHDYVLGADGTIDQATITWQALTGNSKFNSLIHGCPESNAAIAATLPGLILAYLRAEEETRQGFIYADEEANVPTD